MTIVSASAGAKMLHVGRVSFRARQSCRFRLVAGFVACTLSGGALLAQNPISGPAVQKSVKAGAGLYEIVASQPDGTVYVTSTGPRGENAAKVLGLDPNTLAVTKSIDVSSAPGFGIGINDRTQTLYTTNTRNGSVSAIDIRTGKIVKTITLESEPRAHVREVVVDEDANVVYVSIAAEDGKVWVIDGKTNTLSHVIDSVGKTTVGIALDKSDNQLYAVNMGDNEIAVIDLAKRVVTKRIPTGGQRSTNIAFDAKTGRVFVANQGTGDATVVDMKTGTMLKSIQTGAGALGIAFNPNTNQVYVGNRGAGTVTVIDATSYTVVANVETGTAPNTVAVNPQTNLVYVTNKAKSGGRGAAPVEDPNGDTVTLIKP